ncbi:MAG: type III secretion system chaperone [Succinivibrio sp.]|nr:type III secretion system chaperone [Succinivibrio sp.]
MNRDQLNSLIASVHKFQLSPFDATNLSQSYIKDGHILNMSANNASLCMFIIGEKLGNKRRNSPEVFMQLLEANNLGGRLGNIRISYDSDTTAFWLCHDISYDELNAGMFEDKIAGFIKNAVSFQQYIRMNILYAKTARQQTAAAEQKKPANRRELFATASNPEQPALRAQPQEAAQDVAEPSSLMDIFMNQDRFLMV